MDCQLLLLLGMVLINLCTAQQFQPVQPGTQFQQGQQFQTGQIQPGQQFQTRQIQPGQQFPPGQIMPGQQFRGGQGQPGQQFPSGQIQPGQQFQPGQIIPGQQFQTGQQVPGQGQSFVTGQPVPPQIIPGQPIPGQMIPGQQVPGQIVPGMQQLGSTTNPLPQAPGQCVQNIQGIAANCFLTHGFQIQLADAIITNGTVVPIPAGVNVAEQKSNLCNVRTEIIQCTIPKVLNLRGKAPCTDEQEFLFAESQIVNRLSVLQTMCGADNKQDTRNAMNHCRVFLSAHLTFFDDDRDVVSADRLRTLAFSTYFKSGLTPSSECLRFLKQNMRQCHVQAGFSQDMFASNTSSVKGAIIGRDRASAAKFCGSRNELFTCMRGVIDGCPGAQEYMLLTGYDHNSMENSIELLCGDIGVYVDGLDCFQDPPQEVTTCFDNMMSQMIELTAKQMEATVDKDKYMDEYCRIRVEHLSCDMQGWKKKCKKASVGLKNEHECTLLPGHCQKDPTLQKTLKTDVCNEKAFSRHLRDNGAGSRMASVFSVVLGALSVIFVTIF